MARNDHRDHLRRVPLFADLGDHELDVVGASTTELDLSAGHTLIREGEIAHEMFVVEIHWELCKGSAIGRW